VAECSQLDTAVRTATAKQQGSTKLSLAIREILFMDLLPAAAKLASTVAVELAAAQDKSGSRGW
jgi:hypothetical protein